MTNFTIDKELLNLKNMLWSVVFVLLFSFAFLAIYHPFSASLWFGLSPIQIFTATIAFFVIGVTILVISKMCLHFLSLRRDITLPILIAFVVAEFILVGIAYIYCTEKLQLSGNITDITLILKTSFCVGLILVIPYSIVISVALVKTSHRILERKLAELAKNGVSKSAENSLVNLYDNNGTLRLTLNSNDIYLIESQDNYAKIYYNYEKKLNLYMLRCKLSALEQKLAENSMVRCHRSYIVNTTKIKMLRNEKGATFLVMDTPEPKVIPVSKSYREAVLQQFK